MQSKLAEWEEKGFYIFNLPPYSPHLNIIEILWRKIKYEWLKPEDYLSFESLTKAIKEILSYLGAEYKINFENKAFRTYAVKREINDLQHFLQNLFCRKSYSGCLIEQTTSTIKLDERAVKIPIVTKSVPDPEILHRCR